MPSHTVIITWAKSMRMGTENTTISTPSPSIPVLDKNIHYYVVYMCLYALGLLYGIPSVLSWIRMWRNIHTEDHTAIRLFSLLGIGSLLRAFAFGLVALWMYFVVISKGTIDEARHLHLSYVELVIVWQAIGMVASFFLVCVFLLVCDTWANMTEQVHTSFRGSSSNGCASPDIVLRRNHPTAKYSTRNLFIRILLSTYIFQMVTFSLITMVPANIICQRLHLFTTTLLGVCFLVCIVLLPSYGRRMCDLLSKVAEGADRRQRNVRRIALISTVFCTMRAFSQFLLIASAYGQDHQLTQDGIAFDIPLQHIMEANPIFFFGVKATGQGLLHWIILIEVVEFPIEWALLMSLLCVLPSRAVLPSIRGYQSIPDFKRRL